MKKSLTMSVAAAVLLVASLAIARAQKGQQGSRHLRICE